MTQEEYINEIATFGDLSRVVINQLDVDWDNLVENIADYTDASAGVPGFIYTADNKIFVRDNYKTIMQAYHSACFEYGGHLFGDPQDPDWLAWFALESVTHEIMMVMGQ